MRKFPLYKQLDQMDCGPTCLRMVAKHYGKMLSLASLRDASGISREGVSLLGISQAAEKLGFLTQGVRLTLEQLRTQAPLPCIVHWDHAHFVVVYAIKRNTISVADPMGALVDYSPAEFCAHWAGTANTEQAQGIALLLEPTAQFHAEEDAAFEPGGTASLVGLFDYLRPYRKLIVQLLLGLVGGSLIQLILPFLTTSIVDVGIRTQNLHFIYVILGAQLALFVGRSTVEFIRSWILMHISIRINVAIITDFLVKLMKLPVSFFDVKLFGDIMQRINDQKRIESFLTGQSLDVLFSAVNLLIFSLVLWYFNQAIFLIFLLGSALYSLWVLLFLAKRRKLDFRRFDAQAKEQSAIIELVQGMQEIKLANAEQQRRWRWEAVRLKLFKLNASALSLTQLQLAGAHFINEGKNILTTFMAARAVIAGDMTLGTMLSVQYIIGQLNGPIEQLVAFVQTSQEAKISFERLNEIHRLEDEERLADVTGQFPPADQDLVVRQVSFGYEAAGRNILHDINLCIPSGKVTAIVGSSGSGKTTLLKLLLKFYAPSTGDICLGPTRLQDVSHKEWRSRCGVVGQEGFLFSDTIAANIAVGDDLIDTERLLHATTTANIDAYVRSLPLGYNTRIGADGNGLSQGQKQRILIARAVYKNPAYLFFDEATNALDANNEAVIMDNLEQFFQGRTVVVVAHRLSTVRNADQIIVLDNGRIVEQGSHHELVYQEGYYYQLIKNQLELGA